MGQAYILRGDARWLPLPDASVDLVVTSPPYYSLRSYRDGDEHYAGQIGSEPTPQEWCEALWACTAEWVRVLKPSGSIWVNLGDSYAGSGGYNNSAIAPRPKSLHMLPARYAIGCIDRLGLILRAEVVWSKPNGLPESVTDRVRRSHEQWFHFTKQGRYFAAVDEIRTPLADKTVTHRGGGTAYGDGANHYSHDLEAHGSGWGSGEAKVRRPDPRGALPGSVWVIPSEPLLIPDWAKEKYALPDHFAAFPQEWPRRIILGWSPSGICTACGEGRRPVVNRELRVDHVQGRNRFKEDVNDRGGLDRLMASTGGKVGSYEATILGYACACPTPDAPNRPAVVLDPFGGTGTTAMVAKALGRTGISVDLSADYCKLARWRIEESGHGAKAEDRTWRGAQGRMF